MNLKTILKGSGIALVALGALLVVHREASAQGIPGPKGPCLDFIGLTSVPPKCEDDCVVYCDDFCNGITWFNAGCANQSGACQLVTTNLPTLLCRECTCTWPFGGCKDDGLY